MKFTIFRAISIGLVLTALLGSAIAQTGTPSQRLEIMRQKLETLRTSLKTSASVMKRDKSDENDENNPETPLGRLVSLEKDSSKMLNEVNTTLGKLGRAEKVEIEEIALLEEDVSKFQAKADKALLETAEFRSQPVSQEGKARTKKKKKKFLGIFGGGTDEFEDLIGTVTPGRDRELFIVATREVRKRNFEVGRLLFQTIISTYPDSPYLPMAKLAVADTFYLEGSTSSLIQAAANYQDWWTFFRTHPLADRVLLKVAESEMRQIGLPDRDISKAKKAEQRLEALLQQYPNSSLRPLVEARLGEVQDNLGLHNLYVGNFYYKLSVKQEKGGLKGAQSRYLEILEKYPNFSFMDEALYKLAVTYLLEEETDQAARYFQDIVRDYPNSDHVKEAKEQLELIGAKIPEPNPERLKVLPEEKASFFNNFKNEFLGIYPLTIDKDGVLMTKKFDETKFELIDQVIENQGDLKDSQIPKSLTTVISIRTPEKSK